MFKQAHAREREREKWQLASRGKTTWETGDLGSSLRHTRTKLASQGSFAT